MNEYRDALADESEVTWLEDQEEFDIAHLWTVSLEKKDKERVSNYMIVQDRCKSLKHDTYEVYELLKNMNTEFNNRI